MGCTIWNIARATASVNHQSSARRPILEIFDGGESFAELALGCGQFDVPNAGEDVGAGDRVSPGRSAQATGRPRPCDHLASRPAA